MNLLSPTGRVYYFVKNCRRLYSRRTQLSRIHIVAFIVATAATDATGKL